MTGKANLLRSSVALLGFGLCAWSQMHGQGIVSAGDSLHIAVGRGSSIPGVAAVNNVAADKKSITGFAIPDVEQFPSVVPEGRPSVGLVLEGGGALGMAHIGVLQWFDQNHIPVDRLAGTSMGALIGGLYASGQSANDLQQIVTSNIFSGMFAIEAAYTDVSYRRRQDRKDLPQGISLGLKHGVSFRNSLLTDAEINAFLVRKLHAYNSEGIAFDELPIPFRCVATDLNTLEPVVFSRGSMPEAIRASISLPGVFSPVNYHGHYLVDGAIVDNLPTDVMKNDLHADVVIAVHLSTGPLTEKDVNSILGVFSRAFSAGTGITERSGMQLADILLKVDVDKFSATEYEKAAQLIQAGYQTAEQHRTELMRYRLNDSDWSAYVAARASRKRSEPGILREVKVEGGSSGAQRAAKRNVEALEGKPIDAVVTTGALRRVEGSGSYKAWFETFAADQPRTMDATTALAPDTGIVVHLSQARNGPPFLMLGADLTSVSSNVTRNSLDFRLVQQDVGGFGSEVKTDVHVGFQTQLSLEYYRQLTMTGLFLQPHIGILRQPVYLWNDQKRISERFEQEAGGGLDFGRTFNRNTQLAAEWRALTLRWQATSGSDNSTNLSGTVQTGTLHFTFDSAVASSVSPSGRRLDVTAGALFHTVGSDNAPLVQIKTSRTFTFHEKNILGLGSEANTYFRRNVADALRFTLGGPLRLSASSIDEYRGTDDWLVRSGYLRRIAPLPSGFGQGVYVSFGYEAGEIWSPERRAFLRQDGIAAVVAATPIGVITLGGSIGDAGRRKVFFTLGRLF